MYTWIHTNISRAYSSVKNGNHPFIMEASNISKDPFGAGVHLKKAVTIVNCKNDFYFLDVIIGYPCRLSISAQLRYLA